MITYFVSSLTERIIFLLLNLVGLELRSASVINSAGLNHLGEP